MEELLAKQNKILIIFIRITIENYLALIFPVSIAIIGKYLQSLFCL